MTGTPPVPAATRVRIERAIVEAERLLTNAEQQPAESDSARGVFVVRPHAALDRALVPAAVAVLSTIVGTLSDDARRYAWTADQLCAAVDHCSEETTARLFAYCPHRAVTLEDFRRDVLHATRQASCWRTYQDTREELSGPPPFHVQLRAALDEAGMTVEQLAERIKRSDPRAIYRNLAGIRPHPKNVRQYQEALSAEVGHPVQFVPPPKNRKRQ